MTVKEILYTIKNDLQRVDKTSRFHPNLIRKNCNTVWEQILNSAIENGQSLDFYGKEHLGVSVSLNATTNRYESTYPAPILKLGVDKMQAVRQITTAQGTGVDFVPMTETESRYMRGLDLYDIDTTVGCFIYYNKIVYDENMTAALAAAGVRLVLIHPFDEYTDTEDLPLPEGQGLSFITSVVQLMSNIPVVDLENKNR